MKCPECGGTEFVQLVFFYLWEYEYIDIETGAKRSEEIERDYKDLQESWHCANCDDYWPKEERSEDWPILDKLSSM